MPTGTLPESGKKLFEEVYKKAKEGSCKDAKDVEACAAGAGWTAVKNAGWKKDKEGKWTKSTAVQEFSMYFEKAPFDKQTGAMSWRATASDTSDDLYNDNMSLELFKDFISRIELNVPAPEEFCSDAWKGGEPYLSVSHYSDLNGKGIAGKAVKSWIDGKCFKSQGVFESNDLGKAAFKSVWEDLRNPLRSEADDKVRISIAFIDWKHMHKMSGFVFERQSLEDICPECIKELITGETNGRTFLKGHLIHEALTRVPVNQRTSIETDFAEMEKSMTTQKEDAKSIIGEELAEELETVSKQQIKSAALIIHSDVEDAPVIEEAKTKKKDEKMPMDEEEMPDDMDNEDDEEEKACAGKKKKKSDYSELKSDIQELRSIISELKIEKPIVTVHPLDPMLQSLKSKYDEIQKSEIPANEKLQAIQEEYTELGHKIVEFITPKEEIKTVESKSDVNDMIFAFGEAVKPLAQKMDLMIAQLQTYKPAVQQPQQQVIPQRRSIDPSTISQQLSKVDPNKPLSISQLARKSVGLS